MLGFAVGAVRSSQLAFFNAGGSADPPAFSFAQILSVLCVRPANAIVFTITRPPGEYDAPDSRTAPSLHSIAPQIRTVVADFHLSQRRRPVPNLFGLQP